MFPLESLECMTLERFSGFWIEHAITAMPDDRRANIDPSIFPGVNHACGARTPCGRSLDADRAEAKLRHLGHDYIDHDHI